jgi:hypothetical protein
MARVTGRPGQPQPDAGKVRQLPGIDGGAIYNLYVYYQNVPC